MGSVIIFYWFPDWGRGLPAWQIHGWGEHILKQGFCQAVTTTRARQASCNNTGQTFGVYQVIYPVSSNMYASIRNG